MKKINKYILEKFKISKDIKNTISFNKRDVILRLFLFINLKPNDLIDEATLILGGDMSGEEQVFYFNEIVNDHYISFYWSLDDDEDNVTEIDDEKDGTPLFINSKNFYQCTNINEHNKHWWYTIYLDKYNAIEFINKIWKKADNLKVSINDIMKYFDIDIKDIPAKNFDGMISLESNSDDAIEDILNDLKNAKS